jgi:hypothetical protein
MPPQRCGRTPAFAEDYVLKSLSAAQIAWNLTRLTGHGVRCSLADRAAQAHADSFVIPATAGIQDPNVLRVAWTAAWAGGVDYRGG